MGSPAKASYAETEKDGKMYRLNWSAVITVSLIACICFPLASTPVLADVFTVEDTKLTIPPPDGYRRVRESMGLVYSVMHKIEEDPLNDLLAMYISEWDAYAVSKDEMPSLEKYYVVKVMRASANMDVGTQGFAQIKARVRTELEASVSEFESQFPNLSIDDSEALSQALGDDRIFSTTGYYLRMKPYYETASAIAYPMYTKSKLTSLGIEDAPILAGALAIVNVGGKVVLLYCRGQMDDLEWAKAASQAWVKGVLARNAPRPATPGDATSGSLTSGSFDTFMIAVFTALWGGLFVYLNKRSKAKRDRSKAD